MLRGKNKNNCSVKDILMTGSVPHLPLRQYHSRSLNKSCHLQINAYPKTSVHNPVCHQTLSSSLRMKGKRLSLKKVDQPYPKYKEEKTDK